MDEFQETVGDKMSRIKRISKNGKLKMTNKGIIKDIETFTKRIAFLLAFGFLILIAMIALSLSHLINSQYILFGIVVASLMVSFVVFSDISLILYLAFNKGIDFKLKEE